MKLLEEKIKRKYWNIDAGESVRLIQKKLKAFPIEKSQEVEKMDRQAKKNILPISQE